METEPIHPQLVRQHIDPLQDIIDSESGTGWGEKAGLFKALRPSSSHFMVVAYPDSTQKTGPPVKMYHTPIPSVDTAEDGVTEVSRKVVLAQPAGVCIAGVFNPTELASFFLFEPSAYPPALGKSKPPIGVVQMVAVHRLAKQNGVGEALLKEVSRGLEAASCNAQAGIGWKENDNEAVAKIMNRVGYSAVREYPNYWFEDSLDEGYNCVHCGPPPCRCTSILYLKV